MNTELVNSENDDIKFLRKYTTLPVLLDILYRKKLTFLKPNTWSDKNDVKVMEHYQKEMNRTVLASCFSYGEESVYHWSTFANGPAGCMIEFKFKKFMDNLHEIPDVLYRKVNYLLIKKVKNGEYQIDDLPFLKRRPYTCEDEFRILLLTDKDVDSYGVNIDLSCISAIKISPSLPKIVAESVKNVIEKLIGDINIKICQSTLLENSRWINYCSKIKK